MKAAPATSYVRDLVDQLTGARPSADADGDFLLTYCGADFYVRVKGDPAIVQVFSVLLADVEPSAELLVDLNVINTPLAFARIFHVAGQILVEQEMWAEDVEPGNFNSACFNVARASDHFGHRLHEAFGGTLRFEQSKSDSYEPPEHLGLYL